MRLRPVVCRHSLHPNAPVPSRRDSGFVQSPYESASRACGRLLRAPGALVGKLCRAPARPRSRLQPRTASAHMPSRSPGDPKGPCRSGSASCDHHVRHAASWDGVRTGLVAAKPTRQEAESSSQKKRRPREGLDDGVDCVAAANSWPSLQPSRPVPGYPIKRRTSVQRTQDKRAENTGAPGVKAQEESPP
jgi:hypothetical protein